MPIFAVSPARGYTKRWNLESKRKWDDEVQFRDLGAQYIRLKGDIDQAIESVLVEGVYIGGHPVKELEEELAEYAGMKHCISCANGTDALQLALMAWGVGEGDAVFVPDFTFFSSGEVVSAVGATPVFVDVDPVTFNINPDELKMAIRAVMSDTDLNPRVVVTVDLFGLPADYTRICSICDEHGLLILEDAAQGFGGSIGDRMACSFGDISTTSFFPAKPLGCYGDGGAIFTNDDEWAALIRSYAVHGKGSMKYDNVRIGMNSRLDTIQAAILLVKLKAFVEYELEAVNEVACWYNEAFCDAGLVDRGFVLPTVPIGYRSSWAQYTIQLPLDIEREGLRNRLNEQGVPTMIYYPKPMHQQVAFRDTCICSSRNTISNKLCEAVLSLPMGPYMSRADVDQCVHALNNGLCV